MWPTGTGGRKRVTVSRMFTVKTPNVTRAQLIAMGLGLGTVLVSRFLPNEIGFWRDLVGVLGASGFGVGAVQIVSKPAPLR